MANGFGSLYIGVAGLQSSQNALNVTANNLANVDTVGYVRQQVLFVDRDYITINTKPAISKFQTGLGVTIGDVVHTRDLFLDRSYRTESSRQAFYAACYETVSEVETYFQELEGMAFQNSLKNFWEAFEEFYKGPDSEEYQDLVIQKAQLFLSRASAVYDGLKSYQYNINTQISDDIDRINELGKVISELNNEIRRVEAGNIETAMTLRDARDQALDELSSLIDIEYTEDAYGTVRVSTEGTEFITDDGYFEMGMRRDKITGFITPYWPHLSDTRRDKYVNVFNFNNGISFENKNDTGELKALVLARGDHMANYRDVENMNRTTYNKSTGMSIMLKAESELDQLIHGIVTALNDIFCPNVSASSIMGQGVTSIQGTTVDGKPITLTADTKILDAENCSVGSDGKLPPQELFTRVGTDRYTEATCQVPVLDEFGQPLVDENGDTVMETKTIYIYNEEDPTDSSKQYTLQSLKVNQALVADESLIPYMMQNGDINQELAAALSAVWSEERLTLNPNDPKPCSFKEYYQMMIGEMGTLGNVYGSEATHLTGTVASIDNSRQQVIGVSSDEELTYMIKFQNAYNASSRFINVVDEMIEHLITQLG